MSEQPDRTGHAVLPPRTGVAAVDDALDELAPVLSASVDAQVPAVERAHERLRAALDHTE